MSSEHFYTKYEFWCGNCGHNVIGWEDENPVQCSSCRKIGGTWDRCEVKAEGRSLEDMHRIIDAVERIVEIMETDR